ncbi:MAG: chaperone modulator CbpM [Desulfopila sp.]
MKKEQVGIVLDDSIFYGMEELCRLCKVHDRLVREMIEEGMLAPVGDSPASWRFSATSVKIVQVTVRLQRDLGVNLPGAALVIELLDELTSLRLQLGDQKERGQIKR